MHTEVGGSLCALMCCLVSGKECIGSKSVLHGRGSQKLTFRETALDRDVTGTQVYSALVGVNSYLTCHLACDYSVISSPRLLPVLAAKKQRRRAFLIGAESFVPRISWPCPDLLSAYILCGHFVPISPGPCRGAGAP